jgi:photoactive yellow protein
MAGLPEFDAPDLARLVEGLSPEDVDRLEFGAIAVDASGVAVVFNDTEARQSGYGDRPRVGKSFFTDIAPCLGNERFKGRVDEALAKGTLDISFSFTGDFSDRGRILDARVQSRAAGGYWIFMRRA